ncbi:DUF3626 domain-containing protein [Micromonospora sp. STR1s_5]|nr:DUF3626 domain-containing protein [Micromonospora sp. STR1s_5]
MSDPVSRALAHVRGLASNDPNPVEYPVTINFHPDLRVRGASMIDLLARDGLYRSQFETGVSNGGLTAHPGGDRWVWESRTFGRAYDGADPAVRPKYGALNHRRDPVGGSRRFGSCHLRLRRHVLNRTTFCYPDSVFQPKDFGIEAASQLVALAEANRFRLDPVLDNYVEAHLHGELCLSKDVEAVVLDPSYRGTSIEASARTLECPVEWHDGFQLDIEQGEDCERYRGRVAADALGRVAVRGVVTPAVLGSARDDTLDYQTAKWVWHCVARLGRDT